MRKTYKNSKSADKEPYEIMDTLIHIAIKECRPIGSKELEKLYASKQSQEA
jgi:transcriptional regulator of heat shock response